MCMWSRCLYWCCCSFWFFFGLIMLWGCLRLFDFLFDWWVILYLGGWEVSGCCFFVFCLVFGFFGWCVCLLWLGRSFLGLFWIGCFRLWLWLFFCML